MTLPLTINETLKWLSAAHLNVLMQESFWWRQCSCWVVQVGLTPLTFAWHCLSPLAAFTFGAYFVPNGRQWHWICKFYAANFKGIFGGLYSERVWQQAITCCSCYKMPQNAYIFSTNSPSSGHPQKNANTLFFYPPSPFPSNFCNCSSGGIYTASQF